MKAMTADLFWVASLLLQLRTVLLCHLLLLNLFFFFPHKSSGSRSEKSPKCMPAKSLISAGKCWKKKELWEPLEPFTVLRTVRSNCGLHESLLFSSRTVLDAKRTTKMNSSRFSWSDRTVQSGFQNLGLN